jgi:ATP synthase protein I
LTSIRAIPYNLKALLQGSETVVTLRSVGATKQRLSVAPVARMSEADDSLEADEIKPLSREEAKALLAAQRSAPPSTLVIAQFAITIVAGFAVYLIGGRASTVYAVVMGGLAAAIPNALMVYGMSRSKRLNSASNSVQGMWFWYAVKVFASIAFFAVLAFRVPNLEWLALLVSYVVALKVSWVVYIFRSRSPRSDDLKK